MIVVDASVLAPTLADDDGDQARARLRGEALTAPDLVDVEVAPVRRRLLRGGQLSLRRAELALADLLALPLRRISHRSLLPRSWSLRENLTTYDAAYVALAETLGLVLVASDARLPGTPGLPCDVEVLTSPPAPGESLP